MKLRTNSMVTAAAAIAAISFLGHAGPYEIFQNDESRNFEPRCVVSFNGLYSPPAYNIEQISGLCFTLMKEHKDIPTCVELFLGAESKYVAGPAYMTSADYSRGTPARYGFSLGTLGAAYGGLLPGPGESDWAFVRYRLAAAPVADARAADGGSAWLDVYLSRVSTAVLIRSNTDRITLFRGIKPPDLFAVPQDESVALVAHRAEAGAAAGIIGAQGRQEAAVGDDLALELVAISEPWVLAWWGMESLYSADFQGKRARADKPVLLVFSEAPCGVVCESGWDGLTFKFLQPGAAVVLQPLCGDAASKPDTTAEVGAEKLTHVSNDYAYPANVTEGWLKSGLPETVRTECGLWCERLARYPVSVRESYAADAAADRIEITEKFAFIDIRKGGTSFALLPPMLALSRQEGLQGLSFSGEVKDTGLNCGLGPVGGIEGDEYKWAFDGVGRYVWEELSVDAAAAPEYLRAILEKEIAKIVDAGHMFPFWMPTLNAHLPMFGNPGDTLRYLAPLVSMLPEGQAGRLLEYLRAERETYPPEHVFSSVYYSGASRSYYGDFRENWTYKLAEPLAPPELPKSDATDNLYVRLKMMPIENFYALAQYYALAGGAAQDWPDLQCAIEPWLAFQDWAALGMPDLRARKWNNFIALVSFGKTYSMHFNGGVMVANRFAAGAIGYTRLARMAGDAQGESFGLYLTARGLVQRHAMACFMDHLYRHGLEGLLDYSNWAEASDHKLYAAKIHNGWWPRTRERHGISGEIRQVVALYHGGPTLNPLTGMDFYGNEMSAAAFVDVVPEVARFLKDNAFDQCARYIRAWDEGNPLWHAAYKASETGGETLFEVPSDSHSLFVASALVRGDKPDILERKLDIPYCVGDFYFLDKLRLGMAAYGGGKWSAFDGKR